MADLFSISGAAHARAAYQAGGVARTAQDSRGARGSTGDGQGAGRAGDLFEVSDAASYLNQLRGLPTVRQEVVDRAKRMIADGDIDTPEKLEAALDEMIRDALGEDDLDG